jgi:hypothetical protein
MPQPFQQSASFRVALCRTLIGLSAEGILRITRILFFIGLLLYVCCLSHSGIYLPLRPELVKLLLGVSSFDPFLLAIPPSLVLRLFALVWFVCSFRHGASLISAVLMYPRAVKMARKSHEKIAARQDACSKLDWSKVNISVDGAWQTYFNLQTENVDDDHIRKLPLTHFRVLDVSSFPEKNVRRYAALHLKYLLCRNIVNSVRDIPSYGDTNCPDLLLSASGRQHIRFTTSGTLPRLGDFHAWIDFRLAFFGDSIMLGYRVSSARCEQRYLRRLAREILLDGRLTGLRGVSISWALGSRDSFRLSGAKENLLDEYSLSPKEKHDREFTDIRGLESDTLYLLEIANRYRATPLNDAFGWKEFDTSLMQFAIHQGVEKAIEEWHTTVRSFLEASMPDILRYPDSEITLYASDELDKEPRHLM